MLTYVLVSTILESDLKVGHNDHEEMVSIGQQVICAIVDFDHRVIREVGEGMAYLDVVVQMIRLVVSVASVVQDDRI